MKLLNVAAVVTSALLVSSAAFAQCPAVNVAPGCNAVITITNTGYSIAAKPLNGVDYDGSDDALIGIVNNSSSAISSVFLNGNGVDIFGFDGDGLTTFGVPGNAKDSSGYGGPNVFYSGISANNVTGTVNFITPLAANGGSSFFGLEEIFSAGNPPIVTPPNTVTPEPGTLVLLGTGALGVAGTLRRRILG